MNDSNIFVQRMLFLVVMLCLGLGMAHADECDGLKPKGGEDISKEVSGEFDGELKGYLSKLAGGKATLDGSYQSFKTDTLREYPKASGLYLAERLVYLACIQPKKYEPNFLMELMSRIDESDEGSKKK